MNMLKKVADVFKKIGKILEKIIMILVAYLFISMVPHCYYVNKQTEEWLAEPQIGDIYYVNLAKMDEVEINNPVFKSRAYSLLKLISIDEHNLTFLVHRSMTTMKGHASGFYHKNRSEFFDETITIPLKIVHEYHANGAIYKIKRK